MVFHNPQIFRALVCWESWHVQNPGIYRTQAYLAGKLYSQPCYLQALKQIPSPVRHLQWSTSQKQCNFFFVLSSNMSNCNLRETTAIKIKLVLNILAISDILTSIQDPRVEILNDSVAWVYPVYLKSWKIENPGIFRTLPYSQPSYMENLGVYRTPAYLEP